MAPSAFIYEVILLWLQQSFVDLCTVSWRPSLELYVCIIRMDQGRCILYFGGIV